MSCYVVGALPILGKASFFLFIFYSFYLFLFLRYSATRASMIARL